MATFDDAQSVQRMAESLISTYHPDLATARIRFIFTEKAGMKGGNELAGKVRKISGLFEWLLDLDFLILVALSKWNGFDENQRIALVDHLLEHCVGEEDEEDGSMIWKVREPEVQEFVTILQRYGVWHTGLSTFVEVAKEIRLDEIIEEEAEIKVDE